MNLITADLNSLEVFATFHIQADSTKVIQSTEVSKYICTFLYTHPMQCYLPI